MEIQDFFAIAVHLNLNEIARFSAQSLNKHQDYEIFTQSNFRLAHSAHYDFNHRSD